MALSLELISQELARYKEAKEKASEGAWSLEKGEIGCRDMDNPDPGLRCDCHGYGIQGPNHLVVVMPDNDTHTTAGIHRIEDAEFITLAKNTPLETYCQQLIDRVKELEGK